MHRSLRAGTVAETASLAKHTISPGTENWTRVSPQGGSTAGHAVCYVRTSLVSRPLLCIYPEGAAAMPERLRVHRHYVAVSAQLPAEPARAGEQLNPASALDRPDPKSCA